jgi:signal transduction histidine kinase
LRSGWSRPALGSASRPNGRPTCPAVPGSAAGDFAVGLVFIVGGVVVWRRSAVTAGLLIATGVAWFLASSASGLVFLHRGPLVHLLLSYPRGRLESRFERTVVAVAYAEALVYPLGRSNLATLALLIAVVIASAVRHARAGGSERRARAAALIATGAVVTVLAVAAVGRMLDASADSAVLWAYEVVLAAVAAGLCADLLWGRWTQAAVTGLVVDLGDLEREATLRTRLARSVGDPSLELGYWDPARAEYVDEAGAPIELSESPSSRSVLLIGDEAGQRAAAIVHDPAVLHEPQLVEAVTAALRISLANVDLQAQVLAKIEEVRASRRRLVEAADAERRRLEGELRAATGPRLRLLAELLEDSEPAADELRRELDALRGELSELARGIYPRALTESGLAAGLDELAGRFPFAVEVSAGVERLPAAVAAAAYFVCSEGLANAAKHARPSQVRLAARPLDGSLVVEVADDGVGGAALTRGSGLRGLADRVEALGSEFFLDSALVPALGFAPSCRSPEMRSRASRRQRRRWADAPPCGRPRSRRDRTRARHRFCGRWARPSGLVVGRGVRCGVGARAVGRAALDRGRRRRLAAASGQPLRSAARARGTGLVRARVE